MDLDIVIAVFNQVEYTKKCLETLYPSIPEKARVFIIDNGSTDGTGEYLATIPWITVITNVENKGCSVAWNQGVKEGAAEHVMIMNNDVVLPEGWLDGLASFAFGKSIDIASPALREGQLNYHLDLYAKDYMSSMENVMRLGDAHGVCFLVRREVFNKIGYFDEKFRIGGSEDTDFFWRAREAGYTLATTGRSLIHHFGCITQDYIKAEVLGYCYGAEHREYFRNKWHLSRYHRLRIRYKRKFLGIMRRVCERTLYGHTLHEKMLDGKLHYF